MTRLISLLGPAPAQPIRPEGLVAALRQAAHDADPINAMLAADVALELPSDMLVKVDRMSMAHALETRTPYLDQRVVEWGFALPGSDKLALEGGRPKGKRILRSAFRDRLATDVFRRPEARLRDAGRRYARRRRRRTVARRQRPCCPEATRHPAIRRSCRIGDEICKAAAATRPGNYGRSWLFRNGRACTAGLRL